MGGGASAAISSTIRAVSCDDLAVLLGSLDSDPKKRLLSAVRDVTPKRPLSKLPKAHLHLHVWQATLRRSTIAEWLENCDEEWLAEMRSEAEKRLAKLDKADVDGEEEKIPGARKRDQEKYKRRLAAFTHPVSVDKMLGIELTITDKVPPSLVGGSGPESEIWDRQYWVDTLMRTAPERIGGMAGLDRQACMEMAEDAAAEGVCWMELAYKGFKFEDGDVGKISEQSIAEWKNVLTARQEAIAKFPSVGIGFVVHLPKGEHMVEEAKAILDFFSEAGEREALAGFGKWGREEPGMDKKFGPVTEYLRQNSVPLVMFHAGEGWGATGEMMPLEEYDGALYVREAVAAGAKRIGHGIEAARSDETMTLLRERDVCLEVCPYSNWLLAMAPWDDGKPHPLPELIAKGVPCCLAADDPTLMGAGNGHGLVREYEAARHILALEDDKLAYLAKCSIKHCSMPEFDKEKAMAEIDKWLSADPS